MIIATLVSFVAAVHLGPAQSGWGLAVGNLDFTHQAGFSWYCLFLMFSGIALLVIAVLRNQAPQRRIVQALFGIGYFGYGFYLTFIFNGGHYVMFLYAFILPVLLIMGAFRGTARRPQVQPPVAAGGMPPPNLQPMVGPSMPAMADPGLPPVADPGLPPMDPGLPPMPS
jgi:hypothetical protein